MLYRVKIRLFISLPACFMLVSLLIGQELSRTELELYANDMYQKERYDVSRDSYEKLYNIYPGEVKYSYLLGRALLMENINLDKSIKLLRFAASQNHNSETHYYLALAYYRNYQFDEAEIALWNYKNLSKKKEPEHALIGQLEAALQRARIEVYSVRDYKVLSKKVITAYQKEHVFEGIVNGKFAPKPTSFMNKKDIELSYQGSMFYPSNTPNGYQYFISGYARKGHHKDIYKIEQLSAIEFSLPENISALNSEWNEEYPYFDEHTQTLYFSSERKGGLGGYDIYRATYVPETNSFNVPERMEFPINSAHDDFMYVPDSSSGSALFLSNREGFGDNLVAYTLDLNQDPFFKSPKTRAELMHLAKLEVTDAAPQIVEKNTQQKKGIPFEPVNYDILIQKALLQQLKCDSLYTALMSETNKLRVTTDKNERRVLFSSIARLDQQIETSQPIADSLFAEAYKLAPEFPDQEFLPATEKNIAVVKEVNGLKVFNYISRERRTATWDQQAKTIDIPRDNLKPAKEIEFEILEESPYNDAYPIPSTNELPAGLVYRIQLGAFGKKLSMDAFGGLSPLTAEYLHERNLTKYYVGYFTTSKDARNALSQVKDYGYTDAFIVPYLDKRKVSINEAREVEFSQKSLGD